MSLTIRRNSPRATLNPIPFTTTSLTAPARPARSREYLARQLLPDQRLDVEGIQVGREHARTGRAAVAVMPSKMMAETVRWFMRGASHYEGAGNTYKGCGHTTRNQNQPNQPEPTRTAQQRQTSNNGAQATSEPQNWSCSAVEYRSPSYSTVGAVSRIKKIAVLAGEANCRSTGYVSSLPFQQPSLKIALLTRPR